MTKLVLEDDRKCFACGMENPEGLRIAWVVDGRAMTGEYVAESRFQGWKGILHGGIVAALLDEAMTRLAGVVCGGAVTAEMTIRFVAPAKIGETIFIRGEIVDDSRKIVELKAALTNAHGKVIARSTGKAMKIG